tara:strand:- start:51 stop:422 length:372 start_codon:yes stop_codon:yes gene_type:complete
MMTTVAVMGSMAFFCLDSPSIRWLEFTIPLSRERPCDSPHSNACDWSSSQALDAAMVSSTGTVPMNRKENLFALKLIVHSMSKVNPESLTIKNLRRAAYLHGIVEAVLNEQVSTLPQTTVIRS